MCEKGEKTQKETSIRTYGYEPQGFGYEPHAYGYGPQGLGYEPHGFGYEGQGFGYKIHAVDCEVHDRHSLSRCFFFSGSFEPGCDKARRVELTKQHKELWTTMMAGGKK